MHLCENQFPNDVRMPHDVMSVLHPSNYFMLKSQIHTLRHLPPLNPQILCIIGIKKVMTVLM